MEDITEVIRCRRLEVVDADGAVRFLVHCIEDEDEVMLEMHTPKRSGALYVYATSEGIGAQAHGRVGDALYASVGLDGHVRADVTQPGGVRPMLSFDTRRFGVDGD